MPTQMPSDTAALFAAGAEMFDSRPLLLDRFVYDHPTMDEARRLHFARVCADSFNSIQATRVRWQSAVREARSDTDRRQLQDFLDDTSAMARRKIPVGPAAQGQVTSSRQAFLTTLQDNEILHAQLQSRLLVNMAGGVMENAGSCLDRFGLPYVPGSAVKGCARRAALAALHEWCDTGRKPGASEADKDNLFKDACADFDTPADMLVAIARVFGWGEQDWKTRDDFRSDEEWLKQRSDFAWACSGGADPAAPTGRDMGVQGNAPGKAFPDHPSPEGAKQLPAAGWEAIRAEVLAALRSAHTSRSVSEPGSRTPACPKHFAGAVSFLPAHVMDPGMTGPVDGLPVPVPEKLGKLELDVVTCHHGEYYANPDPNAVARDTEEPVPVVFPAVAPGHVFTFALAPLRGAEQRLLHSARQWLKTGLEAFGLGAKTNAGYGWFKDVSDFIHAVEAAEQAREAEQERQASERAAIANRRASLEPDPVLVETLCGMKETELRGQINPFATDERFWAQQDERVQFTLLHFLTITAPALFAADRANPKSKVAKALANLAAKFPQVVLPKP